MKKKLEPVTSIRDLENKCLLDHRYRKLALDAAANIGAPSNYLNAWGKAIEWLTIHRNSMIQEYGVSEDEAFKSIVEEINFCI